MTHSHVAAVVILYHPNDEFVSNIQSYAHKIGKLFLIDNTEQQFRQTMDWKDKFDSFSLITEGQNTGVAAGLNKGMAMAINEGFEWVLTMDQDSSFEPKMIDALLGSIVKYGKTDVAVIGPSFDNRTGDDKNEMKEVNRMITSGSLMHVAAYQAIGPFNEALFIDEVDHEYGYRARQKKFRLIVLTKVHMNHQLGKSVKIKFPFETHRSLHSPVRLYYMVRNGLLMIQKYKSDFPSEIKATQKDILIRIKNNLLFSSKRWTAFRYIIKGYLDFKRNKYGKL